MAREVIDVDELDIFCTGVRHCIRIDRTPSPRPRKRPRNSVTISLVDDNPSSRLTPSLSQSPPMNHCTELQRITQSELRVRTALLDTRSPKKRATEAIKIAMSAVKSHNELKRKERERVLEVIEISSDSEPESWPSKKRKVDELIPPTHDTNGGLGHSEDMPKLEAELARTEIHSDIQSHRELSDNDTDDDDYINSLASLDISNERNWAPLPERNKAEDLTPMRELDIVMSKPPVVSRGCLPRRRPFVEYPHAPLDWASGGPWGIISRNHGVTKFPKPFYHARRQDRLLPRRAPSLYHEQGYTKLELTAKYPHLTSGSINKIIQKQGTIVLAAVVEAGLEDSDDDDVGRYWAYAYLSHGHNGVAFTLDQPPPPAENKAGSLVVYHRGRVHVAPAHRHLRDTSHGTAMKHYSISDVAFNPLNLRQFLSSGYDLAVQMWEVVDSYDGSGCEGLKKIRSFYLGSRPQDLVYSPDGLKLVISCHNGTVRLYSQDLFEDMIDEDPRKTFCIAPKGAGHAAGATLWGEGPSEQLLFTSSEPTAKDDHTGFHHAFDTHKGVQAVKFDATESGDAAALSPDGTTLVLFTWGNNSTHPVRLYDVRRKLQDAYEMEELEDFHVRPVIGSRQRMGDTEEVNHASFSPDERLLAVARSDNALHVYDVRALSRGPLCRFEHHDSDAVGGGGFGLVSAEWIQSRNRIAIASGGNDGCVRLWEPALGSRDDLQGMVIGRTDFDVAHFSVGNRDSGESPLVIGDFGGGMHMYDYTGEDGTRI